MNLHRIWLFAVPLMLICIPAFSTDDVLSTNTDSRLDQRVDFVADGLHVSEALGSLALKTGVNMAAGVDEKDWMVRDRKIIVIVHDMSLRDLMREIANILHFNWTTVGTGAEMRYALLQTDDQAKEEQSLRDNAKDAQANEMRKIREAVLSDMANLGSLTKQDAAKLANTDPWRYVLASEPLGRDIAGFFSSFPDARNAFLQGTQAGFPVSKLSPDLQATVKRIAESYQSLQERIGASEENKTLDNFDKMQVTIEPKTQLSSELMAKSLLGGIRVGSSAESIYVPIFDPSSGMAKALGRAIVRLQTGLSKAEVGKQLESELKMESQVAHTPVKSGRDITSDPSLSRKVTLYTTDNVAPLAQTLKVLAEKSGMNVISDCLPGKAPAVSGGEKSLGQALEMIRNAYESNWEKSGDTLRFRDAEWFMKRAWEVPQVWIDYWIARGKTNNGLLLEDLVQIARLRDAQIEHTITTDPALVGLGAGEAARNREILRFYASLDYEQQKTMATQRLDVSTISDDQWSLLQKALAVKGAAYAAAGKGSQFIRLDQSGSDVVEYRFDYYPGDGDMAVEFKLTSGNVYGIGDPKLLPNNKIKN